ncbi:MAG TPA: glycoside hydrolase family 9 protein [Kiritimatiellia bacterium]|nr:glycoside hydrolase family 9 protein [Kiritimatiellia bacterium]
MNTWIKGLVGLGVCGLAGVGFADGVEAFRSAPDRRPAVRQSFGVRGAWAMGPDRVAVAIGMSWTDAGANPVAYRIISRDDPAYAYERFVRPLAANVREETDVKGVRGSAFPVFMRRVVELTLPSPLQPGATYTVLAQGVGQTMVTAARTAATFDYDGGPGVAAGDPRVDEAVIGLRAVDPVGNGILLVEFGPGLAPETVREPGAWSIQLNGEPVEVTGVGRLTRVDSYVPAGWPFAAIPQHEIFVRLARPFRHGDTVSVSVAERVTAGLRTATLTFDETTALSPSLKVNQVGYLTDAPAKHAYLGRWMGSFPETLKKAQAAGNMDNLFAAALAGDEVSAPIVDAGASPALLFNAPPVFRLCDAKTHKVVFEGKSEWIHRSGELNEGVLNVDHSGEHVYRLDFTAFAGEGTFYLAVPGVGRSHPFRIARDVYAEAFAVASYGIFAQRCGCPLHPPHSDWQRIACHAKGIVPTTLSRAAGEHTAHRELPAHVDYSRAREAAPAPELAALNRDAALLAHWPLDGDFRDVSGNGRDLTPLRTDAEFTEVRELSTGLNRALGPSALAPNGGSLTGLMLDAEQGFTFAAWLRLPGGIRFNGTVLGHLESNTHLPRIQLTAGWGVLRAFVGASEPADIGRLSDGNWNHVAVVVSPAGSSGADVNVHVNGERRASAKAKAYDAQALATNRFVVGGFDGEEAHGKFIDDVRVYGRALSVGELATLARKWGEAAISLQAKGGHHDAGDYNPRSHIAIAQYLMNAYEMAPRKFFDGQLNIPERGNGIPDILDEAAWSFGLWLGLQEEDGGVFGGTESNGDPNFIQSVDLDVLGDYAFAKESAASYEFAGVMAQASRIWAKLGRDKDAADFLARARRAYAWAVSNPFTGAKDPEQHARFELSPKAYAAAQLLHTTGEAAFHGDFAATAVWSRKPDADLAQHRLYDQSFAAWAYLNVPAAQTDPALRQSIHAAVIRQADLFLTHNETMAYRFVRHPWAPITWGTGAYQNWLDPVIWAYQLTGDRRYLQWILHTCDNTLGANPLGISYITGLGRRTVRAPLHNSRYSEAGEVAPGIQVQGPNQRGEGYRVQETAYPRLREDFANLYTFVDNHFAIAMNEGTVVPQVRTMAAFGLLLPDAPETSPSK